MGPKYEFTEETLNYEGHLLHRIKRLSDGKIGGWIEKEENLSQEGNCWVDNNAEVYDDAYVCDNAQIYDNAEIYDNAHVYGNAKIYDTAWVRGNAKVYDNAQVYDDAIVYYNAEVYGNARVYDKAHVCGNVKIYEDAQIYGDAKVFDDAIVHGNARVYDNAWVCDNATVYGSALIYGDAGVFDNNEISSNDSSKEVIQDFIYKIDNSNKLEVKTEYDSIDEFFNDISNESYNNHEYIAILTVDTKIPIIKLEKTNINDKKVYRFIVDITNEDGDNFSMKSIIDSKDKFNQLLQSTIDSLKNYPQFTKYANDLQ